VRALEVLGRHYLSDRLILDQLVQLFVRTPSPPVQAAVAGILIRADRRTLASAPLLRTLQHSRLRSPQGSNIIDALFRRLQPA
jgi:hypothetical protein